MAGGVAGALVCGGHGTVATDRCGHDRQPRRLPADDGSLEGLHQERPDRQLVHPRDARPRGGPRTPAVPGPAGPAPVHRPPTCGARVGARGEDVGVGLSRLPIRRDRSRPEHRPLPAARVPAHVAGAGSGDLSRCRLDTAAYRAPRRGGSRLAAAVVLDLSVRRHLQPATQGTVPLTLESTWQRKGCRRDVRALAPPRQQQRLSARPSTAFLALAAVVVTGGVVLRLALLGRQSYWIDELYSVGESNGSLRQLMDVGSAEVHPPLYALVLWGWMRIGGSSEAWTRLLSTIIVLVAVLVTHVGLRALDLGRHVRWAMTTATAAGAAWVVYSLETRNYALLLLGATGITITTLRAGVLALRGSAAPARLVLSWFGWTLLAAASHPFGAVLSAGAVAVLVGAAAWSRSLHWPRTAAVWAGTALAGCLPLVLWVGRGELRAGFAAGTTWIRAPGARDVWDLVTTAFGSGGMSPHRDGFAWNSPLGVLGAAVLVVAAAVYRRRPRSREDGNAVPGDVVTAAAILLTLTVVVIVGAFAVSQVSHLW